VRRLLLLVLLPAAFSAVMTTSSPSVQATDDDCYFVDVTIPPDYNPNAHVCPPAPQGIHIGDPL
jgi:hypothetical protein